MAGIIKCPKCGREILSDANFCSFCGIKIEGGIAKSTVQEENTEEYVEVDESEKVPNSEQRKWEEVQELRKMLKKITK